MNKDTDIDIDFYDRDSALRNLKHVAASRQDGKKHASGVYFQNIPVDPISGLSSIPFDKTGPLGYFKIDFLNNSLYENVRDEEHLCKLINQEPSWELLKNEEIVAMLAHIANHFDIVKLIEPKSIEDLAIVLALIRPGKRYLITKPRAEIEKRIWEIEDDGFQFKKSHSISYALSIVVQLNLLAEG